MAVAKVANGFTLEELARGQTGIADQLHEMREEHSKQHHRLRNDLAPLVAQVGRNEERIHSQGREIGALSKRTERIEDDYKWLLRAIIGAYGAIAVAVVGLLLTRLL